MTNPESNRFLTGPILKPLILFALPLMLALLLQALYGAVDLAVVGQFSDAASVCAVSTGSQVMLVVTSLISGLTMGVTVLVGKAVGAGDLSTAGKVVSSQIRLFLAAVVLITVPMLILAPQIARLLQVPDSAMTESISASAPAALCVLPLIMASAVFSGDLAIPAPRSCSYSLRVWSMWRWTCSLSACCIWTPPAQPWPQSSPRPSALSFP